VLTCPNHNYESQLVVQEEDQDLPGFLVDELEEDEEEEEEGGEGMNIFSDILSSDSGTLSNGPPYFFFSLSLF
jgi:hypothetical protein